MSSPDQSPAAPECYRHPGREAHIRCQRCDRPICPDCMRDAAVGFQCPGCVSEGAKTTRSGRTPYGGLRSGNAALTSQFLIAINVGVWIAAFLGGRYSSRVFELLALKPEGTCDAGGGNYFPSIRSESTCDSAGGIWIPGVVDGAPWQLLSSVFVHVEVWHIAVNMLALWFLGPQLELALGRLRFLALYVISGLGGSALVFWFGPLHSGTHGASGAIFGLMAALLILAYKVGGNVQEILYWVGLNALITLVFVNRISWQGHLGGFLTGAALMAVLIYAPKQRRTTWQAVGVTAIALLVAVAIAARFVSLA